MYYNHNIKKKGISDNYLPNYHTSRIMTYILIKLCLIKIQSMRLCFLIIGTIYCMMGIKILKR